MSPSRRYLNPPALFAFALCAVLLCGVSFGAASAALAPLTAPDCETSVRPPPEPAPRLRKWIGQYGDIGGVLDISERCGVLVAEGRGFKSWPLRPIGADRFDGPAPNGPGRSVFTLAASTLLVDGVPLARRDFGAETEAGIRAGVHADPGKLRAAALAAKPPREPPPKRASDLASLPAVDPTLHVRSIYAGPDNLLGIAVYEKPGAYLQRPVAEALARASAALRRRGFGLLVTDAYRPWFATKMFWDATPPEYHNFVADPAHGSRHNRGCAVDLTLYDLKSGRPVEMTGRIDEMSPRSFSNYTGGTSVQRWRRDLLRQEMERQGFTAYSDEWWHFDYKDWPYYPIGTATYAELMAGTAH